LAVLKACAASFFARWGSDQAIIDPAFVRRGEANGFRKIGTVERFHIRDLTDFAFLLAVDNGSGSPLSQTALYLAVTASENAIAVRT
jgi:hypothetical protein